MKLQFDFYDKEEFAIQIEGNWKSLNDKESELFIFIAYTLRQMFNIGDHIVNDALSGALIDDPQKLLDNPSDLSDGFTLIARREQYLYKSSGMHEESLRAVMSGRYPQISADPFVKALDETILRSPKITNHKGDAKKQYIYYPQQGKLDIKGFGFLGTMLGQNAGYYAFNSTLALYRYLGNKRRKNDKFISALTKAAELCAQLQMSNQVPTIQITTAEAMVNKILDEMGSV